MDDLVQFWEQPDAAELYMIAGWRQWADAGSISSGLPEYLIELTNARKIGAFRPNGYYLFQIPGTHHLLRPTIKLEDGYRRGLEIQRNEIFYAGNADKGLLIFLGDEPHLNVDQYAAAFFSVTRQFNVQRVAAVGGVYGPVPYDQDREISCIYSLPALKAELEKYALRFSNYEGGATIGAYLVDRAEHERVEFITFYGFVPAYDFAGGTSSQEVRIDQDYKAWYEILRRFNHMFRLNLNLSDLEQRALELLEAMDAQMEQLEEAYPQLETRAYLEQVAEEFTERPFSPLDDVWAEELEDLFRDMDE